MTTNREIGKQHIEENKYSEMLFENVCSNVLIQEGVKNSEDGKAIMLCKQEIKRLKARLHRTKEYYQKEKEEMKNNYFVECEKNEKLQERIEQLEKELIYKEVQVSNLSNDLRISEMGRNNWKQRCLKYKKLEEARLKAKGKTLDTNQIRKNFNRNENPHSQ